MCSYIIYLALCVLPDGTRNISLGLCIYNAEGATSWMKFFSDLKTRGVDIARPERQAAKLLLAEALL